MLIVWGFLADNDEDEAELVAIELNGGVYTP